MVELGGERSRASGIRSTRGPGNTVERARSGAAEGPERDPEARFGREAGRGAPDALWISALTSDGMARMNSGTPGSGSNDAGSVGRPADPAGRGTAGPGAAKPGAGVPGAGRPGAIVIGASSGIGAALVRALAAEGLPVAAVARRSEELERLAASCRGLPGRVIVRVHDTRDAEAVPALFEELARELGGVELAVYAAAVMPKVDRHGYDTAVDLDMLAINFGGCVAWCNALAGFFQSQRSGTLIGISSIAGDRGRKPNPMYGATKAAMDHYLEALRNRLSEVGVHVCTIKPGYVDTRMTQGMQGLFWLISADEAARRILSAARGGANVRYVPRRWWFVGTVLKLIPSFVFRKLSF